LIDRLGSLLNNKVRVAPRGSSLVVQDWTSHFISGVTADVSLTRTGGQNSIDGCSRGFNTRADRIRMLLVVRISDM
jgi:hypothetical protein